MIAHTLTPLAQLACVCVIVYFLPAIRHRVCCGFFTRMAGILSSVCFCIFCSRTDISVEMWPIGAKFCIMDVPDVSSPLLVLISLVICKCGSQKCGSIAHFRASRTPLIFGHSHTFKLHTICEANVAPKKSCLKIMPRAEASKGHPRNAKYAAFWGYFACILISRPCLHLLFSSLSLPLPSPPIHVAVPASPLPQGGKQETLLSQIERAQQHKKTQTQYHQRTSV